MNQRQDQDNIGENQTEKNDWKNQLKRGFNIFSQKVEEGFVKTVDKLKEVSESVKIKIDEKIAERNLSTSEYAKLKDNELPEAFCVNCGDLLNVDLRRSLFSGDEVICEKCGEVLRLGSVDSNN